MRSTFSFFSALFFAAVFSSCAKCDAIRITQGGKLIATGSDLTTLATVRVKL